MKPGNPNAGLAAIAGAVAGVALAVTVGLALLGGSDGERRSTVPALVTARPTEPAQPRPEVEKAPPPSRIEEAIPPVPKPPIPSAVDVPSGVELIAGFESEEDLRIFENLSKVADAARVTEHATQGLYSLRMKPIKGKRARLAGSAWLGLKADWSGATRICLDVYVESGAPLAMKLEIRDKPGGSEWDYRREISFTLNEGLNQIQYRIEGLVANDHKRKIVLSEVNQFHINWPTDKPFAIYVDNIRLEE